MRIIATVCILVLGSSAIAPASAPPWRLAACAWLPDGCAVALVPTDDAVVLRTTQLPHPRTLADFKDPIVLFGPGGRIQSGIPDNAQLAVSDDALHVFFTTAGRLHCAVARLPVSASTPWTFQTQSLAGDLRLRPVAVPESHRPLVLVLQHEPGRTGSNLHLAAADDGTLDVGLIVAAPDYVAGADASVDSEGRTHLVWSEAAPEQPIRYAVFDADLRPLRDALTLLDAGQQPTIAVRGKVVLLATEAPTGGINLWRIADGTIDRCEHLDGRMHFRPRFARDMHNVTWLFALDRERRAMYYRRLLGGGFGTEQIAYGVQGRREHALEFSLPARLAGTQAGFPILHHADLPEGGAPQFRFDLLPVPQLAVTDSRRVLFLDLLEVAALDNAVQRLGIVRKSDANPLPLQGPPQGPDEAWVNYPDVMFDAGRFRMWYSTNTNTFERNFNVAYAESNDGLHWTKPSLGLVPYNGSRDNNLLFPNFTDPAQPPAGFNAAVSLVVRDDDDPDPARRYKMIFISATLEGANTIYLTWSADGIHWHLPPHRLWGKAEGPNQVIRGQAPWVEPLSSFFRDPIEPHPDYRWKLYGIDSYSGHPHMDVRVVRSLGVVHGATPYAFEPYPHNPVIDPRTGVDEDQNHGGSVQVYEGVYVSLYQHWFDLDWKVDLRLATSRDGLHFTRILPDEPFLPLGRTGAWDSGMLCTPNRLILHEDQLWLYYRGSVGTLATGRALSRSEYAPARELPEPWRINAGLARLRRDGFTYLTVAPLERRGSQFRSSFVTDYDIKLEARVRTIPIAAAGIGRRTLHVNVGNLAPRFAWLKAQLRNADTGDVIPGFSFEACDPVEEDRLDHTFTWNGSSSLAAVNAERVQVEFLLFGMLESPRLYSFWFE